MKRVISLILQNAIQNSFNLKLTIQEIEEKIEIPPDSLMGDFAFPCFFLSSKLRKAPNEIALKIKNEIKNIPKEISEIKVSGAYLNFFVDKKILAVNLIKKALKEKEKYGNSNEGKGKTIVIDMSSPNIAKPFGIGHLRSTIIGNSISNIAKSQGYKTVKINYLGDWGTQFGKMIAGYKKIGNDKELKKDQAKNMLKWYIEGNKKEYEEDARKWFKKLEDGDKEALKLWKMFKYLSMKDFEKTYKILGVKFDVISGESFYNNKMDKTIKELKSKKLLEQSEGALIVNLDKYNLGVCLIQKTDGATLYATRDLTAAIERYNKYKFSKMIYEVGQEQKLHFQQVFKVLELMNYKFSKECVHASHGLYLDEDGKKFATRKGKTIFMEDILNETIEIAKNKIQEKNPDLKNKDEIAEKIAIAAIFYGDLKNQRTNDIVFNIEKFLDFEGNTGPYLQYSYARASSILRKASKNTKKSKSEILNEKEIALIKKINDFPEAVKKSYEHLFPNLVANYSFELAQKFNEFYHSCPVIGSENEQFRLKLVEAFRITIKKSLYLLCIEIM